MNTHITEFLERVRPFLVAADEQDVLREIAGSIEDKATGMPGGATDESIIAAIAAVGDPRTSLLPGRPPSRRWPPTTERCTGFSRGFCTL
jgi:hypothetical protein